MSEKQIWRAEFRKVKSKKSKNGCVGMSDAGRSRKACESDREILQKSAYRKVSKYKADTPAQVQRRTSMLNRKHVDISERDFHVGCSRIE